MSLPLEQQPRRHTVEEYLRIERDSSERHDYIDGEIVAMSGGSYNHSLIISNTVRELGNRLKGKPCRALESNLRVGIPRTPRLMYPDILVICGKPEFDPRDDHNETVTNPRLVIEVLSPTTERHDRGEKFRRYRQLESLQEYVLVSQERPSVETYFRQPEGTWLMAPYAGMESTVRLRSVEIDLPMTEIYAGVEFPPPSEEDA
jgi:Uma2 family endonuclease